MDRSDVLKYPYVKNGRIIKMTKNVEQIITLATVKEDELEMLKMEIGESFMKGLQDSFPNHENPSEIAPVPSSEDIHKYLTSLETVTYQFILNGERIGGAVLKIDTETQRNEVDFFYINANGHGKGLGTKAWQAIEAAYLDTKIWVLYTPYFEKRNIHFYVNKCGFKIVEFLHRGNPSINMKVEEDKPDAEYEFFRFEKVMKA